jgi:hypothetical protein
MESQRVRRSDRITLELPLQVSGADAKGLGFVEDTQTEVVSRHGAKILSRHQMGRDQEIVIRCLATGKEADARIVGQVGEEPRGYYYGVGFLDPEANIWDIEFPPLTESEQAIARVLLECTRCHSRELVYLDALEAEVLEVSKSLSRPCKRCTDTGVWKLSMPESTGPQLPPTHPPTVLEDSAGPPKRTQNERKEVRVRVKMTACIRHPYLGEEIVTADSASRGGFSFRSSKRYGTGSLIDVAMLYTRDGANIFIPARIEHGEELLGENLISYGVSYIPIHKGWPGK